MSSIPVSKPYDTGQPPPPLLYDHFLSIISKCRQVVKFWWLKHLTKVQLFHTSSSVYKVCFNIKPYSNRFHVIFVRKKIQNTPTPQKQNKLILTFDTTTKYTKGMNTIRHSKCLCTKSTTNFSITVSYLKADLD